MIQVFSFDACPWCTKAKKYLQQAPWAALAPSAVMVAVMMVFNMFGDQLRDLLDPKMREKRV